MAAALVAIAAILVFAFVFGPLSGRVATSDQSPSTLLNAGLSAQLAGRTAEAADDYHKVLAKDPNNFWAFYNLGVIEQQAGRPASAESMYRRALAVNPDFVPALYNLAIIRTAANPKEAESLYRHAITVQPGSATAHLNLGFLLIQEGNTAEGTAELKKAVQLDPNLASRLPPASPTAAPSRKP